MSEKEQIEEPADDAEAEAAPAVSVEQVVKPAARSGNGVAWLSLLIAVIALVAVAYTIYEDWRTQQELQLSSGNIEASMTALGSRIDDAKSDLAEIQATLDELARADAGTAGDIDTLDRRVSDRLRQLEGMPLRISNLEASIATLQGVSTGARDTWLLGEAEYYMQLANAQLQLAGNPKLAALALGMADERIAQLANPALTNIRVAISDELAALAVLETTDVEGITLTLASLARVVDSLPIREIERIEEESTEADDAEAGRLDRAWNAVKNAASGLVRYRSTDETVMPLISPQAEYFLRTNLTLQLQTARLALLRGEPSVFEESLADARHWLETYFDADSVQVQNAIETIDDISGSMVDAAPPDISESLRLLRQHNSVTESAQ